MKHITMNLLDYFWKTGIKPVKEVVENLHKVASTGKYIDLEGRPTIPTALKNPQALTFTGGVTGSYDGSAAKSVKIPSLTNNLLATAAGTALDAAQGKVLDGKIAQINSNLSFEWVTLTLKYGSTQAWNQLIIRKFGNICILVGVLVIPAGAVAWEKRQIFTFPAEFVPTGIINTMGVTNNNKICRLMTDGTKADIVFQENITAGQEIWFNVPYISG